MQRCQGGATPSTPGSADASSTFAQPRPLVRPPRTPGSQQSKTQLAPQPPRRRRRRTKSGSEQDKARVPPPPSSAAAAAADAACARRAKAARQLARVLRGWADRRSLAARGQTAARERSARSSTALAEVGARILLLVAAEDERRAAIAAGAARGLAAAHVRAGDGLRAMQQWAAVYAREECQAREQERRGTLEEDERICRQLVTLARREPATELAKQALFSAAQSTVSTTAAQQLCTVYRQLTPSPESTPSTAKQRKSTEGRAAVGMTWPRSALTPLQQGTASAANTPERRQCSGGRSRSGTAPSAGRRSAPPVPRLSSPSLFPNAPPRGESAERRLASQTPSPRRTNARPSPSANHTASFPSISAPTASSNSPRRSAPPGGAAAVSGPFAYPTTTFTTITTATSATTARTAEKEERRAERQQSVRKSLCTSTPRALAEAAAAGRTPRLSEVRVDIDDCFLCRPGGGSRHVRYAVRVALRADPACVLWRCHRRYSELAPAFRRLRARAAARGRRMPEVPGEARIRTCWRALRGALGGACSPRRDAVVAERRVAFTALYNSALLLPQLAADRGLLALLGLAPGAGKAAAAGLLVRESFAPDTQLGSAMDSLLRSHDAVGLPPATPVRQGSQQGVCSPGQTPWRVAEPLPEELCESWIRVRMLGRGAYGTVFLGLLRDARQVAVKVVDLPALGAPGGESERARAAVDSECQLLSQLDHPNIVRCLGHRFADGGAVLELFLEFVSGGTVAELVRKVGPLPPPVLRSYAKQSLLALDYLHSTRGGKPRVAHRDIKADNALITACGALKLADFGCSKIIGEVIGGSAKTLVGTWHCMAPEVIQPQWRGRYGVECDVWSLGCLCVEMLGATPWGDLPADNQWERLYAISQAESGPSNIPAGIDPKLRSFLAECFVRDARRRAPAERLLFHQYITCDESTLV
eukprot:TRINITY_DN992_c0_g2_i1.p1 TRINITY_DN992_c0_g2~~TRINITY_DN992_c0_g2_i1.p1  ORF type:complete len:962 (+),score=297.59 TRINITY_DN992_c0_g2_i1:84-2888(+)